MNRVEYKYLVPVEALADLRRAIFPFVELDRYARNERREYTVHSIYFDTISLDYYHQKLSGIRHRKKVRIRGYNELEKDSRVFLEIKRKDNMFISKHRALAPFRDVRDLLAGENIGRVLQNNGSVHAIEDAGRFLYHVYRYALRPVVLISYEREAFYQRFDRSVRITLDKNLRSSSFPALEDLFNHQETLPSLVGRFIFEIKFYKGIPSWLKTVLGDFDLQRTAVSKYTISLDTQRIPEAQSDRYVFAFSKPVGATRSRIAPSTTRNRHLGQNSPGQAVMVHG